MATNLKRKSKVSISSVKSVVEKVPKTRACPWVAQWFTIPQAVVKILQFMLSIPVVVLLFVWNSRGVTIADLNNEEQDINYRNTVYGFIGIGILSTVYAVGLSIVGISGLKIPPIMQSVFAIIVLITWLIGAPVMSASVEQLSHTSYIRMLNIDTLYLVVATGLGFALLVVCLIDVLLGFQAMRTLEQESKEFTREMSQSKSVMMAVRSGQSFTDARSALSITEPVDETSPLKSHEEAQDSEEQD